MSDPYGKPGQQDSSHAWPDRTTTQQPAPAYQPQPRYAPPRGHAPQPGYPPQPAPGYQQTRPGFPQQDAYPPQGYPQQQGYPPQPGVPPIVINNVANASAAAFAGGYGHGRRKTQSFWVHFWLFWFTLGIGNILYAKYVMDWNKKHGY
ncbi:hypothetical protein [Nocardia sp. NPDC059239]|uniref:hypothetical protein n=1 Tax=Nocardia sp. NPDC059239 TaxID=3346785 RepID=UPI0036877996